MYMSVSMVYLAAERPAVRRGTGALVLGARPVAHHRCLHLVHRVTGWNPGRYTYGIGYGRPYGPREAPTKPSGPSLLRLTVVSTIDTATVRHVAHHRCLHLVHRGVEGTFSLSYHSSA